MDSPTTETLHRHLEEIVILSRSYPRNNAGRPQKFSPIFRSSGCCEFKVSSFNAYFVVTEKWINVINYIYDVTTQNFLVDTLIPCSRSQRSNLSSELKFLGICDIVIHFTFISYKTAKYICGWKLFNPTVIFFGNFSSWQNLHLNKNKVIWINYRYLRRILKIVSTLNIVNVYLLSCLLFRYPSRWFHRAYKI